MRLSGARQVNFPERVFTQEEVERARRIIEEGYKHKIKVVGSPRFREKVEKALKLIKTAEHHDFLQKYIRGITEIEGLSQLREADAAIWANMHAVAEPIEAAGFLIQKAQQMKDYLEGRPYFRGPEEATAVRKRIEFLETLKNKSKDQTTIKKCEETLKRWEESKFL